MVGLDVDDTLTSNLNRAKEYKADMIKKWDVLIHLPHTHPDFLQDWLSKEGYAKFSNRPITEIEDLSWKHYDEMIQNDFSIDFN